jgi:hypothetical protein
MILHRRGSFLNSQALVFPPRVDRQKLAKVNQAICSQPRRDVKLGRTPRIPKKQLLNVGFNPTTLLLEELPTTQG